MTSHWIESFAEGGANMFSKYLSSAKRLGEITVYQGLFSNPLLYKTLSDTEIYRTDFPLNDYNTMLYYEPKKFHNFNRFFAPGTIFRQLYPTETLDTIYAFQVFNSPSVSIPAPDHILATLSQEPIIQAELSKRSKADLRRILSIRANEVVKGGNLLFDILSKPKDLSVNFSWDCLDLAYTTLIEQGEMFEEHEKPKLNLHTCFRSNEEVKEILEEFKEIWKIKEIEEKTISMPAYEKYIKTGVIDDYLDNLVDFWKYPCLIMMRRVLGYRKTHEEILLDIDAIMNIFKDICGEMKPVTEQQISYVVLEKI
ncbi:unnamed protein product [Blepharisma stoltei]|uniref:Uncharacterized protein n=1 Tax=Blepharisma stoltei TaxID=1481888 RepID=A0AAU9J3G8_9CILI|nr:unnamed protein product [Blepharisma stoltei]